MLSDGTVREISCKNWGSQMGIENSGPNSTSPNGITEGFVVFDILDTVALNHLEAD
jgi:hypothetical protein